MSNDKEHLFIPVKNNKSLARDVLSKGIINNNEAEFRAYKARTQAIEQKNAKLNVLENKVLDLENRLAYLESLIKNNV